MQKLRLEQTNTYKLSPQQIQSIRLLQLSAAQMQTRIAKELEENPVLVQDEQESDTTDSTSESARVDEPLTSDQFYENNPKGSHHTFSKETAYSKPVAMQTLWQDQLQEQLACLNFDKRSFIIGKHLIGSIESDGYMRRSLEAIVDELAFVYYIETDLATVTQVLEKIKKFEPAGIGARDLQECLLLQLNKKFPTQAVLLAKQILTKHFVAFTKKHYEKIATALGITNFPLFREALKVITKLNPRPLVPNEPYKNALVLRPDFLVTHTPDGKLEVSLYKEQSPRLKIHKNYTSLLGLHSHAKDKESKEAIVFVKEKMARAQWFIDAIKQRRQTLLRTMQAIVDLQYPFFEQGDEAKLRPIFLRNVAEKIGMDVSTISRVVSNKAVQTDWGIYPLKYFFSEAIGTTSGVEVSSRVIKKVLANLIKEEDKLRPYSDAALTALLKEKGYLIARRTVAKYREQLTIPVARLRKMI